ncbi:tyrosine-type recombinase/integrase [Micromonospora endolithica]|uniref:Site-specific integrase n=1 Tax=Micromonospora endolithica TaxID=230091 RepID=A0A3A9YVN9_9ACTN|nr:site-specific integrase [Micromonospora endolithica]RKN39980.1 site-specific integrase [Micromonospora endolithica]TWJ26151.1 site-specific recombinase XerD [Micromonospora endolithica]
MARPKIKRTATDVPGVRKVIRTYQDGRTVTKYEARIHDALGKLRNVGTYDTKPAARAAINEARIDVQERQFIPKSAGEVRFADVAEAWLASPHVRGLKPSTQYGYRTRYDKHCKPLHAAQVGRIGYDELSRLVGELMETYAPSTVRHVVHVLRGVMGHAVLSGYIKTNPALQVAKPKLRSRRVEIVLQPPDVEQIVTAVPDAPSNRPDRWRLLVELAVESGCRAGELAGLRVHRLDTAARLLSVEETSQEIKGKLTLGTPKSKAGVRVVDDLNADLCRRLAAHVEGMAPDDFVFGIGGTPYRQNDFNERCWRPLMRSLGMKGVRFHDLRHYHASAMLLITNGDVQYVSKRLGHSRPSITLDVYGHVLDHARRDVSAAFAALRAEARQRAATAEPAPAQPAASATAGGVVDLAAYRKRRAV